MLISDIKLTENNEKITLSANVQFKGSRTEIMFFETDKINKKYIAADASPFLAAVLIPCMKTNENIFIDGCVSEKLYENTKKIVELLSDWDKKFKKIKVSVKETKKDKQDSKSVACFFSAGVDSFYTLIKHKNEIDDLIFVHGADITLNNYSFFSNAKKATFDVAAKTNKNLLTVTANIKNVVEKRLVWDFSHGGALAAIGLFLRVNIKTLYIAGAVRADELFPYGTHPELDKLWSTEKFAVEHDGTEYNRFEKIMNVVSKSPLALKYLRVCTQNIKGQYNCSRCFKCLITMIYLDCAGVLDKSETFDKSLDLNLVETMYYNYNLFYNKQGEMILNYLKKHNLKPKLQEAIKYSLEKSKNPGFLRKFLDIIAIFDQKYNQRRLFKLVFKTTKDGDRNWLFKLLFRRKLFK